MPFIRLQIEYFILWMLYAMHVCIYEILYLYRNAMCL
jgi:hypothetical protein